MSSPGTNEEVVGEIAFRQARLYMHHIRGAKLLRFIVHDELCDVLLVKSVSTKWDKVEKVATELPRGRAIELHRAGKLVEHEECIRPHFLSLTDEQLKEQSGKSPADARAWLKARDDSYELIRALVDVPVGIERRGEALNLRLVLTFSPKTHAKVVAEHALVNDVKPIVIKRLLHKYVWFGMDKNALLNRDPYKGVVDSSPKKYSSKTGRPNSATVLGLGEKYEGRNVTSSDMRIFEKVLRVYYVGKDYTLRKTYEAMKLEYYQGNQYGLFPIRDSRIPTYEAFEYHARRLTALQGLKVLKEGEKDTKDKTERRGYDTDISGAVGEVYDIDATPFNKELVCRYKIDGQTINLGKATALVVFDRDSKKAVGWHVYIGAENWKEGYRLALFCTLTSKKRHLERLGIDDDTAFIDDENIVPASWYADGGPGSSLSAHDALERLRIDYKLAPPDTPYWKPTVEGGLGHSQADQATDAGAYDRRNRARSKSKKRTAKLFAAESIYDLEQKLVKHLIEYNRRHDGKNLLTDEMRRAGVLPSSQAIFSWGVKKMGGVQNRRLLEADIYMALLERKENVEVTVEGISLFGARYQSARLNEMRLHAGRNVSITVLYHPLRMWEVYWMSPDGALDELERDKLGTRNNGAASAHDIEAWNLHLTALSIIQKQRKPKRPGGLSRGQLDKLRELAGAPPKQQRKRATKDEDLARKLESALDSGQRNYDRPDVHLGKQFASLAPTKYSVSSGQEAAPAEAPSLVPPVSPPSTPQQCPETTNALPAAPAPLLQSPMPRRMSTAELFARRRQAALDKASDEGKK